MYNIKNNIKNINSFLTPTNKINLNNNSDLDLKNFEEILDEYDKNSDIYCSSEYIIDMLGEELDNNDHLKGSIKVDVSTMLFTMIYDFFEKKNSEIESKYSAEESENAITYLRGYINDNMKNFGYIDEDNDIFSLIDTLTEDIKITLEQKQCESFSDLVSKSDCLNILAERSIGKRKNRYYATSGEKTHPFIKKNSILDISDDILDVMDNQVLQNNVELDKNNIIFYDKDGLKCTHNILECSTKKLQSYMINDLSTLGVKYDDLLYLDRNDYNNFIPCYYFYNKLLQKLTNKYNFPIQDLKNDNNEILIYNFNDQNINTPLDIERRYYYTQQQEKENKRKEMENISEYQNIMNLKKIKDQLYNANKDGTKLIGSNNTIPILNKKINKKKIIKKDEETSEYEYMMSEV